LEYNPAALPGADVAEVKVALLPARLTNMLPMTATKNATKKAYFIGLPHRTKTGPVSRGELKKLRDFRARNFRISLGESNDTGCAVVLCIPKRAVHFRLKACGMRSKLMAR
jgi:hypothetical protein